MYNKLFKSRYLSEISILFQWLRTVPALHAQTSGIAYKKYHLYPCKDIIYQPAFEDCFVEGANNNCVRVYRGFLYCYRFSFGGSFFVIADDSGIAFWERNEQNT
ncbi:hypothetical protein J2S19_001402 [Metabacillus malikii]|uniref:Secreted protein n=1 Tax=Metabacillus malikii TaxID=1504265 RepID=A0ABT9ZFW5_9BACI|nr:hypothetical protein [Metabacillus malikii]